MARKNCFTKIAGLAAVVSIAIAGCASAPTNGTITAPTSTTTSTTATSASTTPSTSSTDSSTVTTSSPTVPPPREETPPVPDGLSELVAGHNTLNGERINIIISGLDLPPGFDLEELALGSLGWDGPTPYNVATDVAEVAGNEADLLSYGPFAVEPLASSKDLFNIWYTNLPAPSAWGWFGTDEAELPFEVNDPVEVVFVGDSALPNSAQLPAFTPPELPTVGSAPFKAIHLNVFPGSTGSAAALLAPIFAHEMGHALFGFGDKYIFDQYSSPSDPGQPIAIFPSCAISRDQAEEWFGDQVGTTPAALDTYFAAHEEFGIVLTSEQRDARRSDVEIGFVPDGCYGPRGEGIRSSQAGLMGAAGITATPILDSVNFAWASRVLTQWK